MTAMLWTLHRAAYAGSLVRTLRAPVLATVLPVITMWGLVESPLVAGAAGGIVYLAGLTLLGAWDDKDRLIFQGVVTRIRGWVER
jgi:hypothetical protein